MIYKFRMISTEDKAFLRDYEIDSNSLFIDFNKLIQHDLGFDPDVLVSFFLADEEWNKGLELTSLDMNIDDGPVAVPMDSYAIGKLITNRKDRLLYVYDIFTDQHLFLELIDMFEAQNGVEYPRCSASVGEAPLQIASDAINYSDDDLTLDDELDLDDEFDNGFDPEDMEDLESDIF